VSEFHGRMMNIPGDLAWQDPQVMTAMRVAYSTGHRDARHAAAGIALEAEAEIARLRAALGAMTGLVRLKYGNLHDDINGLLAEAEAALEPPTCHHCGGAYEIKTARGEDFPCGYCG
jgi:hypothetical protein